MRQVFRETSRQLPGSDRCNRRRPLTWGSNTRVTLFIGIQRPRNGIRRKNKNRKRRQRRRRKQNIRTIRPLLHLFRLKKTTNCLPRGTLSRPPPRRGRSNTTRHRTYPTMRGTRRATIYNRIRHRGNSRQRQQGGKLRRNRRGKRGKTGPLGTHRRHFPMFRYSGLICPTRRYNLRPISSPFLYDQYQNIPRRTTLYLMCPFSVARP